MAVAKLRIFLPAWAALTEVQIKAADWDTAGVNNMGDLEVKLAGTTIAFYPRGQYVGYARFDVVVP